MKTDTQLRNDVLAELSWDPAIPAAGVGVTVRDGVVTLSGHLDTYAQKYAAERAAQRVQGVKALAVEIGIRLPAEHERVDADIAQAAERALEWNALLPKGRIHPMVEHGWVTLNGEVEWDYQRRAAEAAVRHLMGVKGISNLVKLRPAADPDDVEKKIHDALSRQADRQARRIDISVEGSEVTLRGSVHSWSECEAVQGAAWAAPGVSRVVNQLQVEG